jgi:dTDP-4-amino-4,6-dideoxy-D-galactose acyltransferase
MLNTEKAVSFYELKWDTEFFGVSSAKAILHMPLSLNDWDKLQAEFKDYQFITITNKNSDPNNTQLIGKDTSAFLVDVNIQFVKKLVGPYKIPTNVTIHQSLERNDQITELANFEFSKFTEDQELAKRGGNQVYTQWLINAFEKSDKFFALSTDENDNIDGFVLYSFSDNASIIELIAVSQKVTKGGIGTSLFKAVEFATHQHGFNEINVGTQIRNIGAINFYNKVGCKLVGCHQVYHLWNL